jgi:hypothetical protein
VHLALGWTACPNLPLTLLERFEALFWFQNSVYQLGNTGNMMVAEWRKKDEIGSNHRHMGKEMMIQKPQMNAMVKR